VLCSAITEVAQCRCMGRGASGGLQGQEIAGAISRMPGTQHDHPPTTAHSFRRTSGVNCAYFRSCMSPSHEIQLWHDHYPKLISASSVFLIVHKPVIYRSTCAWQSDGPVCIGAESSCILLHLPGSISTLASPRQMRTWKMRASAQMRPRRRSWE